MELVRQGIRDTPEWVLLNWVPLWVTEAQCHWGPSEELCRLFLRIVHGAGRLGCACMGCMAFHDCGELLRQRIAEELQESEIEGGTTQHCCPEFRWLQEVVWRPEALCSRGWVFP